MKARTAAEVHADIDAAKEELRQQRAALADAQAVVRGIANRIHELDGMSVGRIPRLEMEEQDTDEPTVRDRQGDDWVVVRVTPKQAHVRPYGSGVRGSSNLVTATSRYPTVTLDACRAAWVAAGRVLP